ncbi:hypothetical protein [Chelativorans sp. J32]|uniref:hypothetical protein n=1 Tax=Chelativorans sp. J32 TaxID=935840 RepID=UPI0004807C9D|nr:hypothetical protein [Chelativorans sp. J32]
MKPYALAWTLFAATTAIATAQSNPMGAATGLVTILSAEEKCGYAIDQAKLEEYFVKSGVAADPSLLAFIDSGVSLNRRRNEEPTASICTMARATAEQVGILAE